MIGTGPKANQSGGGTPVKYINIPGTPPRVPLLNQTFQAIAMVQEGMIYGTTARTLMTFL